MATSPESTGSSSSAQRTQLIAVGALVLVLLAVLWFAFLRGGGDGDEVAAPAPAPVATPLPTPLEPGGNGGKGPVETFEVFAPRDPFEPLITEGSTGGSTGDGTGNGTGDGTGNGTGDGTGNGTGDGTGDGTGNGTGDGTGDGGTTVQGHRVQVIDVFQRNGTTRVQVEVDGTVYTVEAGETFAESFELVSASGECASFLFGDDQFTLCEGEEILK